MLTKPVLLRVILCCTSIKISVRRSSRLTEAQEAGFKVLWLHLPIMLGLRLAWATGVEAGMGLREMRGSKRVRSYPRVHRGPGIWRPGAEGKGTTASVVMSSVRFDM